MREERLAPASAGRASWRFALWMSLCVLAALFLAISAARYSRRLMMAPLEAAAPQSDTPSAIDSQEMLLEVVDLRAQGLVKARLLRSSGAAYLRTPDLVWVKLEPSTPVVMGDRRDIHTGAVLDVTAVPGSPPGLWHAVGLTVLTGHIRVSGGS